MRVGTLLILVGALCGMRRDRAAGSRRHGKSCWRRRGFQMRPADSAERLQDLANRPARKIVRVAPGRENRIHLRGSQKLPPGLYVGGAKAYAEYRRLEVSEEIRPHMSAGR